MRGPVGLHRYGIDGPGTFSKGRKRKESVRHVAMIAGGTGVTPMIQIINHVLNDPMDTTGLHLLLANSRPSDIMLREKLEALSKDGRLHLTLTVSQFDTTDSRDGLVHASMSKGSLDAKTLANAFAACGDPDETLVCICGPMGFNARAKTLANECGYHNTMTW